MSVSSWPNSLDRPLTHMCDNFLDFTSKACWTNSQTETAVDETAVNEEVDIVHYILLRSTAGQRRASQSTQVQKWLKHMCIKVKIHWLYCISFIVTSCLFCTSYTQPSLCSRANKIKVNLVELAVANNSILTGQSIRKRCFMSTYYSHVFESLIFTCDSDS